MTTHAPRATPRQPFGVLDNARLQQLTSIKNRQNGMTTSSPLSAGKHPVPSNNKPAIFSSSTKRKVQTSIYEDVDDENVDPSSLSSPTKRSKGNDSTPVKPAFHLSTTPAFILSKASPSSMPPPSLSSLTPRNRANISSPRAPLTAPSGRSPRSKPTVPSSKLRRVSAPYSRIDPPSFNSITPYLPISLDAALKGSLSRDKPSQSATTQKTMPRNWFFDIHEDTPEEEASNLMEHSTLCLDLSSDDETSKKSTADRGKENLPPPGYEPAVNTSPRRDSAAAGQDTKTKIPQVRRKVLRKDEMDDGERSPLSDLEAEDFYPMGLHKDSVIVIPAASAKEEDDKVEEIRPPFYAPAEKHFSKAEEGSVLDVPVINEQGDVAGDIIIFEDPEDENAAPSSPTVEAKGAGEKRKREISSTRGSES